MTLGPDAQMNVWLSSAENHQWNPSQKQPETAWEAEIDRLMRAQASSLDPKKRKEDFDRVQQIAWEQAPFIYLVNRHALSRFLPSFTMYSPLFCSRTCIGTSTAWRGMRNRRANKLDTLLSIKLSRATAASPMSYAKLRSPSTAERYSDWSDPAAAGKALCPWRSCACCI